MNRPRVEQLLDELDEILTEIREELRTPETTPPSSKKRSGPGALLKLEPIDADRVEDQVVRLRARRALGRGRKVQGKPVKEG